jgi:Ca2+-binding EF-hand superfamily protein
VFDRFDANGDGQIDADELAEYYTQSEESLLEKRQESINSLEAEAVGVPAAGVPAAEPSMRRQQSLKKLNRLKSLQSMTRTMSSGHLALMKQMVKTLDKNGDGKVDRKELAAIVF